VTDTARNRRIDASIEQLTAWASSDRNRARGHVTPAASFQLEEPIAWIRVFGLDVDRYFGDPEYYFEHTLRQRQWRWESFPDEETPLTLDVPAWLGHYPEYTFVGLSVAFTPAGVPLLQEDHPLRRDPNLHHLEPVRFESSGWMPRVLRRYDDLCRIAAGRVPVTFNMLWTRGCLDLAIQLRGYENFVADTVERPAFVHDLLRFLTEQRCRWYEAYYRHFGVQRAPTGFADDWLNVPFITPQMFADFVLPRYLDIERFHGGVTGIHSCGNQTPLQRYLLTIKSLTSLEVSPWTVLSASLDNIPPDKHLAISLHPNDVLCATPELMERRLAHIVDSCRGRRYGIGTSGLTPISPDIGAFVGKIRTWNEAARKVMTTRGLWQR
jgi:hypothetical protein